MNVAILTAACPVQLMQCFEKERDFRWRLAATTLRITMDISSETVNLFHPSLQHFIKELLKCKIGIYLSNIRIIDIQSGRPSTDTLDANGDRFKAIIPYANLNLIWEIVFDSMRPEFPPDFGFDDDSFLKDMDMSMLLHYVPTLACWQYENPMSLLQVILELLKVFKKHQVKKLHEFSRLQFEYSSLVCETAITYADVEVLVGTPETSQSIPTLPEGAVNFLILLPIDVNRLHGVENQFENEDSITLLLVTFPAPEGSSIIPQIFLSPVLETAFGGADKFQLPPCPVGSCLMDYVPFVIHKLHMQIFCLNKRFLRKKEFASALTYAFGDSIIEYDSTFFSKATYLLESRDFYFLLHVVIPNYFPADCPELIMQSIYHSTCGKPYQFKCENYPYSPRWSSTEMAERTRDYVMMQVEEFQKNSAKNCPIQPEGNTKG